MQQLLHRPWRGVGAAQLGRLVAEHDEATRALMLLREVEPGVLLARGDLLLDDPHDTAGVALPEELPGVEMVAGLVLTLLGRPAQVGDVVELPGGARVEVKAVEKLAIRLVRIVQGPGVPADDGQTRPPA